MKCRGQPRQVIRWEAAHGEEPKGKSLPTGTPRAQRGAWRDNPSTKPPWAQRGEASLPDPPLEKKGVCVRRGRAWKNQARPKARAQSPDIDGAGQCDW